MRKTTRVDQSGASRVTGAENRSPGEPRRRKPPSWVTFRRLAVIGIAGVALAGCQGNENSSCPDWVAAPNAQLLYPEPGATGVPDDFGILIFAGYSSPAPSVLAVGSQQQIRTLPTPVPSPLPSPAASPVSYGSSGRQIFAESVPTLSGATTYNVLALFPSGCGAFESTIGSFSTR